MVLLRDVALFLACLVGPSLGAAQAPTDTDTDAQAERESFIAESAAQMGTDPALMRAALDSAEYQQSIIDAITRPAEAKPWSAYRPIFVTPVRIVDGRAFLRAQAEALAKVEAETGVPAELIVAIIGVETNYGRNTGRYRVLDALYTLAFHYPPRQAFFRAELGHLFALARDEALQPTALMGSYAGAMGWGQFMPSSYRNFSRDGDGDGRRDLFASMPDVFASIANYFVAHGWEAGHPVAVPALTDAAAAMPVGLSMEPKRHLAELGELGFRPQVAIGHDLPASLLELAGADGNEYWITFQNFYAITRYNRSPMYAMAVYQLAQAISQPPPQATP